MKSRENMDMVILIVTICLLGFGLIMVHSASSALSATKFNDAFFYTKRQLLFGGLGVVLMVLMSRFDYHRLRAYVPKITIFSLILLAIVLIPGVGVNRNGSQAWLGFGSFTIQPSELAKMGLILFLAHYLADSEERMHSFWRGFVPPLAMALGVVGLIMLEPDLGQSVVIMGTAVILLYAAGARGGHLALLFGTGLIGFAGLVVTASYRMARLTAFLDPWKDPLESGYQIIQSLYALGSGGLLGLGLGNSHQKFMYLPEPQTDFIFSIVGEELGLLGAASVLALFCVLIWRGFRTAMFAPDRFGSLLAAGITGMIGVQVLINIGVVTGSIPATGITLPFISYGGSSLTLMLTGVGILLNISTQSSWAMR